MNHRIRTVRLQEKADRRIRVGTLSQGQGLDAGCNAGPGRLGGRFDPGIGESSLRDGSVYVRRYRRNRTAFGGRCGRFRLEKGVSGRIGIDLERGCSNDGGDHQDISDLEQWVSKRPETVPAVQTPVAAQRRIGQQVFSDSPCPGFGDVFTGADGAFHGRKLPGS